ncbi:hypothetical protein HMPREF1986_01154 [Oribacterium sp. oral taxon 078 str. F0263]|nr:hypothetical protein HMPREF1986_01154 [Oribacterium sp. oral taxon 078 str. F0263]
MASADLPAGGTSLREDSRSLRVCLMADFYAMITSCFLPGKIGVFSFRKKTVMLSGGFER